MCVPVAVTTLFILILASSVFPLTQLHQNDFTVTVPDAVGSYTNMTMFTLHCTLISGGMPSSVCDLRNGGVLERLVTYS